MDGQVEALAAGCSTHSITWPETVAIVVPLCVGMVAVLVLLFLVFKVPH